MTNKSPYIWRMPIYAPFNNALEPPEVDPVTDDDMISVCFNKNYLPFILGALAVYTYDDAFNLDNDAEPLAVQRFYTLIGIFAAALEDCGMFDFDVRQNEEEPCILEKFVDGEWVEFANLRLCPPLVRLNINFEIEISFDNGETWETLTDNPVPPIPEPDPGQDTLCVASASVVEAFDQTYQEMKRLFGDGVAIWVLASAVISLIATFIFFPPALPYVATFFAELYAILADITDDAFDETTRGDLLCILREHVTLVDDTAVFDYDAVLAEVDSRWNALDINIWAAISYLLRIVQADGLNRAGSTGVATEADCSECDTDWCFTFDLEMVNASGSPITLNGCTAAYSSGTGWIATKGAGCAPDAGSNVIASINVEYPECFLRRVVVVGTSADRTDGNCAAIVFPEVDRGGTPEVTIIDIENGELLGAVLDLNDMSTGITAEFQNIVPTIFSHSSGSAILKQVTFYGSGECPFGVPNCDPELD